MSTQQHVLNEKELLDLDAWWRASNYLAVGQLYLLDNPLLREPLKPEHYQADDRRPLGHGTRGRTLSIPTSTGSSIKYDLDMIYLSGPGHGGNAMVAQDLAGRHPTARVYPDVSRDIEGMRRLFKQFSFPGGISQPRGTRDTRLHSMKGGELGYSLAHAFGAVMDNPDLILAACVVGDGEAETGPLATAWHTNKFLNPIAGGWPCSCRSSISTAIRSANPTVFSRISHEEVGSASSRAAAGSPAL